ncbi:MAG: ORF6N domain-containing protein [Bdellovibrionales bacterium]|nr:ORF6N domain-containing protein [Bdellovibrionales bacterium]
MTKLEKEILQIDNMIYIIRGQKVMLDSDLAKLYGIETKRLKEQVRRNIDRFPDDFMFELTKEELVHIKANENQYGGLRYLPMVFSENGVAMLSSVLNSPSAIQINISIMRTFMKLRSFLSMEATLNERLGNMEQNTTMLFKIVFERLDSIEETITPRLPENRKKIGIKASKNVEK